MENQSLKLCNKERLKNYITINLHNIVDYVMVGLLILQSLKKGGFYKSDCIFVNLLVTFIGVIYITYCEYIRVKEKKVNRIDIVGILMLCLSLFYILPILSNNYANLSDAIFEMIRYFDMYIIYKIVKNSNNKRIYLYSLVVISIIQFILAIDSLGNRYFEPLLEIFSSGYLDDLQGRISGTFQYANVLAILFAMSVLIILEKIHEYTRIKKYLAISILYICLFGILLTGTRSVIVILLCTLVVYLFYKKNYIFETILVIFECFYSLISVNILFNFENMYIVVAILYLVNYIYVILLSKIYNVIKLKVINKYDFFKVHKKYIGIYVAILCILLIVIYMIIAFNMTIPLYFDDTNKVSDVVNIYNVKLGSKNNISFNVDTYNEDTRYKISVIEVDNNFNSKIISQIHYYDTITNKFNLDIDILNNTKYIQLLIECQKGSFSIENININGKAKSINYRIIPKKLVVRMEELINGSTSGRDRLFYVKDSLKITFDSWKNLFFGVGGEGFQNMYDMYKTFDYTSTELHNSFLQIMLEAGIFAFIDILVIIIYTLKKSNRDKILEKCLLLMLCIHSFIDLNFSYFFMIMAFSMIIACMNIATCKVNNKRGDIIYLAEYIVLYIVSLIVIIVLIRANIAYYMYIPKYSEKNTSVETEKEVIELLTKRVNLDFVEISYLESLIEEYEIYITYLDSENEKNIAIENMKEYIDRIARYSKYKKSDKIKVLKYYSENIDNLVSLYYANDVEYGYNIWCNYIKNCIYNMKQEYYYGNYLKRNFEQIYEIIDK